MPYTSTQRRRIRTLYETGLSTARVAKHLGISQSGVHRYLSERGLVRSRSEAAKIRGQARRSRQRDAMGRAIALYESGLSSRRAARRAGVSRHSLRRVLEREGLMRSRTEAARLAGARTHNARSLVMRAGRLYMEGLAITEVAESIGMSKGSAHNYVRSYYDLMGMPYETSAERRRRLAGEMQEQGLSIRETAQRLGVSRTSVVRYRQQLRRQQSD